MCRLTHRRACNKGRTLAPRTVVVWHCGLASRGANSLVQDRCRSGILAPCVHSHFEPSNGPLNLTWAPFNSALQTKFDKSTSSNLAPSWDALCMICALGIAFCTGVGKLAPPLAERLDLACARCRGTRSGRGAHTEQPRLGCLWHLR